MKFNPAELKEDLGNNDKLVFLPSVFNETMDLLMNTHDYFEAHGIADQTQLSERDKSMYCCEMSRITMRLSCIMAWIMVRKAVHNGKISDDEAKQKYQLDCKELCLHQNIQAESALPPYVNLLLDRTFELYMRVSRLEENMANPEHQIAPLM